MIGMNQVGVDLLPHETDPYHETGRVSPFTKPVEVTCIKNHLYQERVKGPGYYVKKDDSYQ